MAQHARRFLMGQHHRQPARAPGAREFTDIAQRLLKDVAIQEDEGVQGLVLCGRRHMAFHRKVFQEGLYLGGSHAGGMPHAVESDEEAYPVAVGLLGSGAVALHPHGGLHSIHQLRWSAVRIHMVRLSRHGYAYSIIGVGKTRKRANPA